MEVSTVLNSSIRRDASVNTLASRIPPVPPNEPLGAVAQKIADLESEIRYLRGQISEDTAMRDREFLRLRLENRCLQISLNRSMDKTASLLTAVA